MILSLKKEKSQMNLDLAFKKYVSPDLLIMDELGYLSYDCKAADLIFEVINRRYETGSITDILPTSHSRTGTRYFRQHPASQR
ncbi:MAG: ATP-binding protein [Deltaproteobacteria bacterium]|nr:ATP-binding protein [Deltaproteobacteria bacterium]